MKTSFPACRPTSSLGSSIVSFSRGNVNFRTLIRPIKARSLLPLPLHLFLHCARNARPACRPRSVSRLRILSPPYNEIVPSRYAISNSGCCCSSSCYERYQTHSRSSIESLLPLLGLYFADKVPIKTSVHLRVLSRIAASVSSRCV